MEMTLTTKTAREFCRNLFTIQSNGRHVLLNTGNLSKHVLTFEYGNIENASQAENTRAYTYCVDAYAGKHRRKQIQKSEEKSRWRRRQRQQHRQRWQ